MYNKLMFIAITALIQSELYSAQRQWVLPTTTAAEMRNPYTWYWPYAIAAAEGYRDFFKNAQQISNQLYQQAYATQAFSWTTGQAGQAVGQTVGQPGQAIDPSWSSDQGGQGQGNGWQGGQNWNGPGFLEG